MQQPEGQAELYEEFRSRVHQSFVRARVCLKCVRLARGWYDSTELRTWVNAARILRKAAAAWRKRAQRIAPLLLCIVGYLVGCSKEPLHDFTARFEVEPSNQGRDIIWSLRFSTQEYHRMIESTVHFSEGAKIHELIAAGFQVHHISGCSTQEKTVVRLNDGSIAFIGSCTVAPPESLTGGI